MNLRNNDFKNLRTTRSGGKTDASDARDNFVNERSTRIISSSLGTRTAVPSFIKFVRATVLGTKRRRKQERAKRAGWKKKTPKNADATRSSRTIVENTKMERCGKKGRRKGKPRGTVEAS